MASSLVRWFSHSAGIPRPGVNIRQSRHTCPGPAESARSASEVCCGISTKPSLPSRVVPFGWTRLEWENRPNKSRNRDARIEASSPDIQSAPVHYSTQQTRPAVHFEYSPAGVCETLQYLIPSLWIAFSVHHFCFVVECLPCCFWE